MPVTSSVFAIESNGPKMEYRYTAINNKCIRHMGTTGMCISYRIHCDFGENDTVAWSDCVSMQHRDEVIGKWEEGKKWQKRVETLKTQCRDKDAEIEKLKKNNEMLRHAVDRSHTID